MSNDDANSLLMGSGGRSASFKAHGDQVWGTVVGLDSRQQTDFTSGDPLTWDDGKPRMQAVISLQTDERDDSEDDGVRKVYVKIPSQQQKAIAKAVSAVGARDLAVGGKLLVRYVSDAEPTRRGMSGQKQYAAKYEAPAFINRDMDDDGVPALTDEDAPF